MSRIAGTRNVLIAVVASGTLGGAVGALATAATTSSASPAAIAAAVQRVKDSAVEADLTRADTELEKVVENLAGRDGVTLTSVHELLGKICQNTKGAGYTVCE